MRRNPTVKWMMSNLRGCDYTASHYIYGMKGRVTNEQS